MNLLIVRHAIAEEPEEAAEHGRNESARRLTRQGHKRMRRIAKGLHNLVDKVDILASSPLVRAAQTAEILASEFKGTKAIEIAALSPRKTPANILQWLQQQPFDATIALVGHEPNLGVFVGWMMTGLQEPFIEFKKGGAALLAIDQELRPARAKLHWLLKPSHLRKMG